VAESDFLTGTLRPVARAMQATRSVIAEAHGSWWLKRETRAEPDVAKRCVSINMKPAADLDKIHSGST
jgi:hypothetical protein